MYTNIIKLLHVGTKEEMKMAEEEETLDEESPELTLKAVSPPVLKQSKYSHNR